MLAIHAKLGCYKGEIVKSKEYKIKRWTLQKDAESTTFSHKYRILILIYIDF